MSQDAARAMWVWVHADAPPDPGELGAFAAREGVREAFVSVPWLGPTAATRACVAALRGHGIRVAALGGDPAWADEIDGPSAGMAAAWALRTTAEGLFDGVHLDIEPWDRCDWEGREQVLLAGLERAVGEVATATGLPVDVDLVPWIADERPDAFAAIAGRADTVTLMAYRDRAPEILAFSAAARALLRGRGAAWRLGVETSKGLPPHLTFADDGRAVLKRELAVVADSLAGERGFHGVAVHDFAGWAALAA